MTSWLKTQKAELDSSSESVSYLVWAARDERGFSSATTAASTPLPYYIIFEKGGRIDHGV